MIKIITAALATLFLTTTSFASSDKDNFIDKMRNFNNDPVLEALIVDNFPRLFNKTKRFYDQELRTLEVVPETVKVKDHEVRNIRYSVTGTIVDTADESEYSFKCYVNTLEATNTLKGNTRLKMGWYGSQHHKGCILNKEFKVLWGDHRKHEAGELIINVPDDLEEYYKAKTQECFQNEFNKIVGGKSIKVPDEIVTDAQFDAFIKKVSGGGITFTGTCEKE